MANYIGQQIGNYHIQQLLGRGGFADVYLGTHVYMKKRQAAIKILLVSIDNGNLERFCREAEIVGNLRHRHIINVLDFSIENQTPYLVMDYLPQGSLRTRHPRGTQLSLDQVVAYTKQIATALQYAHKQHIIHQDVKPENILLNEENEVVLSDFGLAIIIQSMISLSTQDPAGTLATWPLNSFRESHVPPAISTHWQSWSTNGSVGPFPSMDQSLHSGTNTSTFLHQAYANRSRHYQPPLKMSS